MDQHRVPARVSIVGDGRLGRALAAALRHTGAEVAGPTGRDEPIVASEAVILCVPDSEIAAAAGAAAGRAALVGHTSGATPLAALAASGAAAFGLHPLQTFAGDDPPERFHGAGCAVAGNTPQALSFATRIAASVGMQPFPIDDAARPAYHAAASIASNFLVTLMAAAEQAAGAADIDADQARALLAPLVRSTVENWAALGPERALTGPLARGDEATVETQRHALEKAAPDLVSLFDELAAHTRALAGRRAVA